MHKQWLDLRHYGLHLFLARDLKGQGNHYLVFTGPGVEKSQDKIEAIGFAKDERFPHKNYWIRSCKGIRLSLIKNAFDRAVLVDRPVDEIMPALRLRNMKPKPAPENTFTKEKDNGTELGHASGLPGNANRNLNDAGAGRDAILGKDGPRNLAQEQSSLAEPVGSGRETQGLPEGATNQPEQGGTGVGVAMEEEQSVVGFRGLHAEGELASAREAVSAGDADNGAGQELESDGRRDQSDEQIETDQASVVGVSQDVSVDQYSKAQINALPRFAVYPSGDSFAVRGGLPNGIGDKKYASHAEAVSVSTVDEQQHAVRVAQSELRLADLASAKTITIPALPTPHTNDEINAIPQFGIYHYGSRYAIRSENKNGFGDTLAGTYEEALNLAAGEQRLAESRAAWKEQNAAAEQEHLAAKQARQADDLNGFLADSSPMHAERTRGLLEKLNRYDGVVMTLRERIESWQSAGSLNLRTYEESRIKPMSRIRFNRATQAEQDAHDKKVKQGGLKTVYLINDYEMPKTAYDYAAFLSGQSAGLDTANALESSDESIGVEVQTDADSEGHTEKPETAAAEQSNQSTASSDPVGPEVIPGAPQAFAKFGDSGDEEGFSIDREWQGLTLGHLLGSVNNNRFSNNAFERLNDTETVGLQGLSESGKEQLLAFRGWGGIYQDVRTDNARKNGNWPGERISESLGLESGVFNELLGRHRLESYYTPPRLIESIWKAVQKAGVSPGGRYLEAGCGAAHFFVGAPEAIQRHATLIGVESDPIAARMAKSVAPDAVIINDNFQNVVLTNDFDAVIGNVPFGETRIADPRYPHASHIHDYFIVRGLDQLKVGGVMAVLTSSGTMDKASDVVRQQIIDRADLVAAFRLPIEAFSDQNANVTTDLLFLQKRPPGTQPSHDFTQVGELDFRVKDEQVILPCNQYFIDNPDNVLGDFVVQTGPFGNKLAVRFGDRGYQGSDPAKASLATLLNQRIEVAIPEGIANNTNWVPREGAEPVIEPVQRPAYDDSELLADFQGFVGDYVLVDGEVQEVIDIVDTFDESGVRDGQKHLLSKTSFKPGESALLVDYIGLRDATRLMVKAQLVGSDETLAEAQALAKVAYESFVEKYGPVNGKAERVFADDAGAAEVMALEIWDMEHDAVKAVSDIFTKRVVGVTPEVKIENPTDAFYVHYDQTGQVDIDTIAAMANVDSAAVIEELNGTTIFLDHSTREWVTADAYLSGNVVEKLKQVEQALELSDEFRINFDSLLAAQPQRVPFSGITLNLGCNWIPPADIREYVGFLFKKTIPESDLKIRYTPAIAEWSVEVSARFKREYEAQRKTLYGNDNISFELLLEKLMNSQRPTHTYKDANGNVHTDGEATAASRAKQDEINERFYTWVSSDPERAAKYEELYNGVCNVIRLPKPDGTRITFPGLSPTWQPMPHQAEMVARGMLGFNTMAAHPVGAGKTFEMVATAMKLKQIGMHTKPMIAVPNHMLGQISREAKQMYPGARILMVNKEDLRGDKRKRFMAIARNNDWDIVVCTHSLLNQLSAPLDIRLGKMDEEIDYVRAKIAETDSKRVERNLQARVKTLESQREAIIKEDEIAHSREDMLTIDRIGVDSLYIDEAHLYKNLAVNSSMNVLGITNGGSKRASNLDELIEYLRQMHGRSFGASFFTGTSISNSMCELYVHNKLLRPEIMRGMGIASFDEWAKRFGSVTSNMEALPEGGGFRINERFSKFVNCPEMIRLFRTFADVRTKAELKLPTPKVTTKIEAVPQTEWQAAFMDHLTRRAKDVRSGAVKPNVDNILNIATSGRKAALDMRLVDADIPDDDQSKVAFVAKNMLFEYQETMGVKGTQLGFMDLGTPGKHKEYSTYENLKKQLISMGIPANEIAFIHDAKNDAHKEEIFARVRSGDIRILLGSTEKMGVGTNVQERLAALHNIDCPWRPSDIEQRIGRIARRGNLYFDEVTEYRYTTVDSFDLFMWESSKRKQEFITQGLSDPDTVSREYVEEMDMGHAEVMAVTTGEPRIKEKVQVDSDVAKLIRAKQHWEGDRVSRYSAAQRFSKEQQVIQRRYEHEQRITEALPQAPYKVVTVKGRITDLQDGDTTWLYASPVGAAVLARAPMLEARMLRGNENYAPLDINVGGLEVGLSLEPLSKRPFIRVKLDGALVPTFSANLSKTESINGKNIRELFDSPHRQKVQSDEIARLSRVIESVGVVDFDSPWEHEAKLADMLEKKAELDKWFMAQDFSKASVGEDPFIAMLEDLKLGLAEQASVLPDRIETFEVEDHQGSAMEGDLFSSFERDNVIEPRANSVPVSRGLG